MAAFIRYFFRLTILFYILHISNCAYNDKCIQQNPCLCKFSDDRVIDISGIGLSGYNVTEGNKTYYFYGCKPGKPAFASNNFNKTSLCIFYNGNLTDLGSPSSMTFKQSLEEPFTYDLIYNNTNSAVELICTPNLTRSMLMINPHIANRNHNLIFLSPKVCTLHIHKGGLSVGSTLLILFLIGFVLYMVGSAIILYSFRGARGTEMIPHIDFWRNLPGLVTDGLVFLLNGCRSTTITSAETYDRI